MTLKPCLILSLMMLIKFEEGEEEGLTFINSHLILIILLGNKTGCFTWIRKKL
ncbi:hypothetical protein ES332_A11G363200v1 [Gossypium tomentosum]|uniref:Uncharacterized protein n=1 Tax=Gossypium tomentosum TaxID=34277 RepID=A0A5D2NKP9_GOSTO|nr:hypothetical protein ES332_A11G363200v1 [Gossypium tomentosum]